MKKENLEEWNKKERKNKGQWIILKALKIKNHLKPHKQIKKRTKEKNQISKKKNEKYELKEYLR